MTTNLKEVIRVKIYSKKKKIKKKKITDSRKEKLKIVKKQHEFLKCRA